MGQYSAQVQQFDPQRALQDIQAPDSRDEAGRETGTAGADRARDYVVKQMAEIGLQPAGTDNTFLQSQPCPRYHLTETPVLEIVNATNGLTQTLEYRRDFAEYVFNTNLTPAIAPVR